MAIDFTTVLDAIVAKLEASSTPTFRDVYAGHVIGLPPGGPYAVVRYLGDEPPPEGPMTLGNIMRYEHFEVACYWPVLAERSALRAQTIEIRQAKNTLTTALWADFTLGGACTDLDIRNVDIGPGLFPLAGANGMYVALTFDLYVKDLEGEAIAP